MTFGTSVPCPECGAQLMAAYEGDDDRGQAVYLATCSECAFSSAWETFARRMHPRRPEPKRTSTPGVRRRR